MNPLYNLGISLYSLGARMAAWRSPKVKKMVEGQRQTLDRLAAAVDEASASAAGTPDSAGFDVWFHAASLGEFEQARPMIERLRREHPALKILLTFFSPSGYEVRKNYDQVDCVAYLPFDKPRLVKKFLDAACPKMAIFVKYEFWGNYLEQLRRRGIPTYIISAIFRPDQVFFAWYGGTMRKILHNYDHLFVQDERSRQLLSSISVDNVTVAGDTRFDRVTDVMRSANYQLRLPDYQPSNRPDDALAPTIIVGSSWQADEERYIPYLNAHPEIRWIIAPHEFDQERLQRLEAQIQGRSIRLSAIKDGQEVPSDAQVVIVDSFGKLSSLYRYADIAIIGGGFGAGIHNINEAAVYGIPVVFGPKHQKFKEAGDLIACGGAFEYTDSQTLANILDGLTSDAEARHRAGEAAGAYIKDNLGATDKIYKALRF